MHVASSTIIGTVESVSPNEIKVLLRPDAPQATALNAGIPTSFPRVNSYVLLPNESGATVCSISSVHIERHRIPSRGRRQDAGLVDLPLPTRVIYLKPLATLRTRYAGEDPIFKVRRGVDVFPSVGDSVHVPGRVQLKAIVEGEGQQNAGRIQIGRCPIAGNAPVHVDPDKLFGRHLAVLGNTGAGKSCTVAGLIRWSLEAAKKGRMHVKSPDGNEQEQNCAPNARFIVLDPNGEYARAFKDLDVRVYSVEPTSDSDIEEQLRVPAWLWNGVEWAAFTGAAPGAQRPILFKALKSLRLGLGPPDAFETRVRGRIKRYRDNLRILIINGDHMAQGRREDVAKVLLNLAKDFQFLVDDPICPDDDIKLILEKIASKSAKLEESVRSNKVKGKEDSYWHSAFAESDLEELINLLKHAGKAVSLDEEDGPIDEDTPRWFPLNELPEYVEALAEISSGRETAQWVDTLTLRIRTLLSQGRLKSVLQSADPKSPTLEKWLDDYVGGDQAQNGPLSVIDLSLVPSEITQVVIGVLARLIFEAMQRYRQREGKELPTVLVLDEAHTFVHKQLSNDLARPAARECVRVFERIAREGRKFGLGLVLASQRPSEISPTVLSQCNTFLLHRLVNDRDQELVKRMVPDSLSSLLRDLPSLPTRRAMLLGWAVPAPTLVEIREISEEHRPHSPDPAFWAVWTGNQDRRINWKEIARHWQKRGQDSSADSN